MKKQLIIAMFVLCGLLLMTSAAGADDGKFFGKVYFNYNHDFSKDKGAGSGQTNGFEFTRIYFGYDKDLDDVFSMRFLMDVNYDNNAWRPMMKNAYLSMNCKLVEGAKWYFGMVPMPFSGVNEAQWGYRSVSKMGMDDMGWGNTADLGIRWDAMFNDMFGLEFAVANGAGYKFDEGVDNPTAGDMFKVFELRPTVYLMEEKALVLSAFGSYEVVNKDINNTILSFLGGYDHQMFRIGLEYSMNMQAKSYLKAGTLETLNMSILSAWLHLKAMEKLTILGRFDVHDPNTDVDKDGHSELIFGVDCHPNDHVRFIPNIQMMMPQADDVAGTAIDESASTNTFFLTLEYKW